MPSRKLKPSFRITADRRQINQHRDVKKLNWKPRFPDKVGLGQDNLDNTLVLELTDKQEAIKLFNELRGKRNMRVLRSWLDRTPMMH